MSDNDQGKPNKKVRKPPAKTTKAVSKAKAAPSEKKRSPTAHHPAPTELHTENRPLSTEEMEVHHHPDLHHKAKPWKEYLLEGFMIFIAVMLGFIAENIREDITNNEHARQLTSQLVHDLKADITQLDKIYQFENQVLKSNDTLFKLLQQTLPNADTRKIQQSIVGSHNILPFHPSLGAIGAIKNELHLKQFSNSEIISYIAMYEGHIELLHTVQDITLQYQRSFLDPFLRLHFTPANLYTSFIRQSAPNSQMRNLTQEDLTQLSADMVLIRVNTNELATDNRMLKNDVVNLLNYVTKQYHLENE